MKSHRFNDHLANLRLWQLISPSLPIGGYAYSTGLEAAIDAGWINNEHDLENWISGVLSNGIGRLDLPVYFHAYQAWAEDDHNSLRELANLSMALRESSELQAEDRYLGQALARVLQGFGIESASGWELDENACFMLMFALAIQRFDIDPDTAAHGACWVWCENQVIAALKLMPLGQTAGQGILFRLTEQIPLVAESARSIVLGDIGMLLPGLAIASARHETQMTRLFRS